MAHRHVVCLVSLLLTSAASAQFIPPADFTNYTPGNRWEYTVTNRLVTPPATVRTLITTVDSEIVIDGAVYSVLTAQSFAPDGTPTGVRNTCAYSATRGYAPIGSTQLPNYACVSDMPLPVLCYDCERTGPTTILVSDQSVRFDSLNTNLTTAVGTSGQFYNVRDTFAYRFGRVLMRESGRRRNGDGSYYEINTWRDLTYARVDGIEYGRPAVAGEADATPDDGFSVLASPNPSTDAFRVEVRAASGSVTVDVFDALGRRVDGGTVQGDAAFTFSAPAAGMYVVRARDEAGHTAVRRVVRH